MKAFKNKTFVWCWFFLQFVYSVVIIGAIEGSHHVFLAKVLYLTTAPVVIDPDYIFQG